jgi:hypothetical protein
MLRRLTKAKCEYTPKLLSLLRAKQDDSMWIPGGWLVYILMEKLPGTPPLNFWHDYGGRPAMTLYRKFYLPFLHSMPLTFSIQGCFQMPTGTL